jgi:hypothetical protein
MANITYRLVEERGLTNAEGDANFRSLDEEKLERDGSIAMTGDLSTIGIKSASSTNGLKLYNQNGDLVATFGESNSNSVSIEGSITVGGGSNLNLDGGDITARNIFLSGGIVSAQLGVEYGVSGDGDVFRGSGTTDTSGDVNIQIDIILKLVTVVGSFNVGNQVVGSLFNTDSERASGTITKVDGNTIYVSINDPTVPFTAGETVSYASNSGVISNIVDAFSYEENQVVKIFGASPILAPDIPVTAAASASKNGTATETNEYYYWVSHFRFADGKIAAAYKIDGFVSNAAISLFNETINNKLLLARPGAEYGIAIYRSIDLDDINQSRLIDVLGPEQLGGNTADISYIDFGVYSNTQWSTKNDKGEFTSLSGVVHFPISAPDENLEGWATATIKYIGDTQTIVLNEDIVFNANSLVEIVHDNTAGLQKFIDDQRELGLQKATFPNGVYYTSKLKVPSNFEISGEGKQTIFKTIPWNFEYWNDNAAPNEKGSLFVSLENLPENIFFRNISIDGNFVNNIRFGSDTSAANSYLLNMPNATNINFINMQVANSVGGGIWAYRSTSLRLQDCEILNGGGVSYLGNNFSPLYAGEAEYLTVTNNLFENFLSPVDISVSRIGTVVGNTVRNCGSGLLIYASSYLLSSPNLLMGPDNEFLPSPDTLDSDYNSINISPEISVDFKSPSMLYLERGLPAYLGSIDRAGVPGSAVELASDIRVLTKYNNQEILKSESEFNYTNALNDQPFIEFINSDEGDYGRNNGHLQFKILGSKIYEIPNLVELTNTHSADLLVVEETDTEGNPVVYREKIMGLAYRILATTYTYTDEGERILILASEFFNDTAGDGFVEITLENENDFAFFVKDDIVKIFDHSSSPDISSTESVSTEATVVSKDDSGLNAKITLLLPDSITIPEVPVNGLNTGYLTIRKTFTIAKGRIL